MFDDALGHKKDDFFKAAHSALAGLCLSLGAASAVISQGRAGKIAYLPMNAFLGKVRVETHGERTCLISQRSHNVAGPDQRSCSTVVSSLLLHSLLSSRWVKPLRTTRRSAQPRLILSPLRRLASRALTTYNFFTLPTRSQAVEGGRSNAFAFDAFVARFGVPHLTTTPTKIEAALC